MPLAAFLLKCHIRMHRALSAGTSYRQFHSHYGNTHYHKEQQIEQDEDRSAVLSCHIRKLPYVSDTDRAARADKDEPYP